MLEKQDSKIETLQYELKHLKKLIYLGKHQRFVSSKKDAAALNLFDLPVIEELHPSQVKSTTYNKSITKKQAQHAGRNGYPEQLRREEITLNPTDLNLSFAKK